jgi:hypothetical protein
MAGARHVCDAKGRQNALPCGGKTREAAGFKALGME